MVAVSPRARHPRVQRRAQRYMQRMYFVDETNNEPLHRIRTPMSREAISAHTRASLSTAPESHLHGWRARCAWAVDCSRACASQEPWALAALALKRGATIALLSPNCLDAALI
jgi:hypothetical protein